MSTNKNYGIIGIGNDVQFGKKGGRVIYNTTAPTPSGSAAAFQFTDRTGNLLRLQGAAPTFWDDLTTKRYVDSVVQGLDIKNAVRVATVDGDNFALTGSTPLTIDTVTLNHGDRVLLKNQTNGAQNGIYVVSISGATYTLTRAADADNKSVDGTLVPGSEVRGGLFVFVQEGYGNADTGWVLSQPNGAVSLGTDSMSFTQFSSAGVTQAGPGLEKVGTTLSVATDGQTIYINGQNRAAVKSSSTAKQVMVSQGSGDAVWGNIDLSSPATVGTTVLGATNGGTGMSTYNSGDLIVGGATANTLSRLPKGSNNTVLGIDGSGNLGYRWLAHLRDNSNNGTVIVQGSGVAGAVNYFDFKNSTGSGDLTLSTLGSGTNLNLQINLKGNGLLVAKSGYDQWFRDNRASISNEAFATKGFVDMRVDSIDTTRIQNPATTTFFDTNYTGFSNIATIGSNNKPIAHFQGATANGVATGGERFVFTHISNEVQIKAINTIGAGDINMRFMPQAQGQIFIGNTGAGLIQGEDGYSLTVKGGQSNINYDGGNLVLRGGDGTSANFSGGKVVIRGGSASGTGDRGTTVIQDSRQINIVEFKSPASAPSNWVEIVNAISDPDPIVSGVKFQVAATSGQGDVSIVLVPKGNGLVRVSDEASYLAQLSQVSSNNAFVTKSYVDTKVVNNINFGGTGITKTTDNFFNLNINATTIKVDGSNNVIVSSSNTANQVLLSAGTAGTEATWGSIPLNNANAVSGVLPVANGGTGQTSIASQDILVGNTTGGFNKLNKGSSFQMLTVSAGGNLSYQYLSNVRDGSGNLIIAGSGVTTPINWLTVKNAAANGAIEIGNDGGDTNIPILLNPKGNALVVGPTGYTARIGSNRETFVTKGFVDDALLFNTDALMRRQQINSSFASVMNVDLPLPNVPGRTVYVHRCTIHVLTPITGGSVYQARVVAGANEIMAFGENDISEAGSFVADLPTLFASSNTQVQIQFFQIDGVTPATPTAGNIIVMAEYKIQ